MTALGAMADGTGYREREAMTVLPPGADAQELRPIVAARLGDLLDARSRIAPRPATSSAWCRRSSTTPSGWARSSR